MNDSVMECVGQVVIRNEKSNEKNNIVMVAIGFLLICTLHGCAKSTSEKGNAVKEEQLISEVQTENSEMQETYPQEDVITAQEESEEVDDMRTILLTVNDKNLIAELANNSSSDALVELLQEGPLSIQMSDYGNMEKVGDIGTTLPTNNEQITTEAGDLILYMGNSFVIYYAPNSWNFTRLGKIQDVTAAD